MCKPSGGSGGVTSYVMRQPPAKLEELSQTMSGTFHRDTTVAELAAWWLDTVARPRVRPSTLGDMPVRTVKAEHVARWQSELLKGGLASGTVGDLRVALHMVLEQGVIHEHFNDDPTHRPEPRGGQSRSPSTRA